MDEPQSMDVDEGSGAAAAPSVATTERSALVLQPAKCTQVDDRAPPLRPILALAGGRKRYELSDPDTSAIVDRLQALGSTRSPRVAEDVNKLLVSTANTIAPIVASSADLTVPLEHAVALAGALPGVGRFLALQADRFDRGTPRAAWNKGPSRRSEVLPERMLRRIVLQALVEPGPSKGAHPLQSLLHMAVQRGDIDQRFVCPNYKAMKGRRSKKKVQAKFFGVTKALKNDICYGYTVQFRFRDRRITLKDRHGEPNVYVLACEAARAYDDWCRRYAPDRPRNFEFEDEGYVGEEEERRQERARRVDARAERAAKRRRVAGDDGAKAQWAAGAPEVVTKQLSGKDFYRKETRAEAKAAVERDHADARGKEKEALILKALGAGWKALDAGAKAKWAADATEVEVKKKRPREEPAPPAPAPPSPPVAPEVEEWKAAEPDADLVGVMAALVTAVEETAAREELIESFLDRITDDVALVLPGRGAAPASVAATRGPAPARGAVPATVASVGEDCDVDAPLALADEPAYFWYHGGAPPRAHAEMRKTPAAPRAPAAAPP